MSKKTFQQYGELANTDFSHSVTSGRYRIHGANEPHMIRDILSKLDPQPTDRFLEIGCGPGNILIPLSFMVGAATGIDHPKVIERLEKRFTDPGLKLIGTDFLDYEPGPDELYEKILINSVLEALSDEEGAFQFVDKAADLLTPGGRLLIGDIANVDKKKRFMETNYGRAFTKDWHEQVAAADSAEEEKKAATILEVDDEMLVQTDDFVLALVRRYRRPGWEAFCLPQHPEMPFGHTREDVLVLRLPD